MRPVGVHRDPLAAVRRSRVVRGRRRRWRAAWYPTRVSLRVPALQAEAIKLLSKLGASQMARDGPLKDGDTPIEVAAAAGLQLSVDVLRPWQMRRKKLTGGATMLVPANTPYWVPGPFAPRRFNVKGTWEPPQAAH